MNENKPAVDLPQAPVSAEEPADQGLLLDDDQERLPLVIVEPGSPSPADELDTDSVLLTLDDLLPDPQGEAEMAPRLSLPPRPTTSCPGR